MQRRRIFLRFIRSYSYNLSYNVLYIETFPAIASAVKRMEHSAQPVHWLQLPDAYTHWIMTSHGVLCVVFVVKVVKLFIPAYAKFYRDLFVALKYLKYFKCLILPPQGLRRLGDCDMEYGFSLWSAVCGKVLQLSRKLSVFIHWFPCQCGNCECGPGHLRHGCRRHSLLYRL